jgi:hypothetical protein
MSQKQSLTREKTKGANFRCFSVRCSPPVPDSQNVLEKRDRSDIAAVPQIRNQTRTRRTNSSHRGQVRWRRNKGLTREKTKGANFRCFSVRCSPPAPDCQNVPEKRDRPDIAAVPQIRNQTRTRSRTGDRSDVAETEAYSRENKWGKLPSVFRTLQPACPGFSERPGEKGQVRYCSRASDSESNTDSGKHGDARGRKMLGCFYIRSVSVSPQRRALQSSCSSTPSLVDNLPI